MFFAAKRSTYNVRFGRVKSHTLRPTGVEKRKDVSRYCPEKKTVVGFSIGGVILLVLILVVWPTAKIWIGK